MPNVEALRSLAYHHYGQRHVQDALLGLSEGKEVVASYGAKGYAQRPDGLRYPADIRNQVSQGATSFHFSEETWRNPYMLDPGMAPNILNTNRIGWDLILDIDCKIFEYSALAADLLVKALQFHGITCIGCKFSGNKGFHIAVPFEAFPEQWKGQPVSELFPEAPRKIATYLQSMLTPHDGQDPLATDTLAGAILSYERKGMQDIREVIVNIGKKTDKAFDELIVTRKDSGGNAQILFDAFKILDIDTVLIASRHLLRHVYSLHEKSGLVSIPINPNKILSFSRDLADPRNRVNSRFTFIDRFSASKGEAGLLLERAYEYALKIDILDSMNKQSVSKVDNWVVSEPIPEKFFPPSITQMLGQLSDGRKRALFVLSSFLSSVGWDTKQIEQRLLDWNNAQSIPLPESIIRSHVVSLRGVRMPPNFENDGYYADIGIDCSKELQQGIKNPAAAAVKRYMSFRPSKKSNKPPQFEKEPVENTDDILRKSFDI